MTVYEAAHEVFDVAEKLIPQHHGQLVGVPIVYVFVSPAPKAHGRVVLGRARRVTGLNGFLVALAAGDVAPAEDGEENEDPDYSFFVMEIAREEWDRASDEHRAALVDHELCHFAVGEDGELSIVGHDLEEFNAVVARHGLWRDDVIRFAGVCSVAS